jgi:iron complex transport system substrate-binding protein
VRQSPTHDLLPQHGSEVGVVSRLVPMEVALADLYLAGMSTDERARANIDRGSASRALGVRALTAIALVACASACSRSADPSAAAASPANPSGASEIDLYPALASPPQRVVAANAAAAEFIAPLLGPERIAAIPEQVDAYASYDFRSHGFENVKRFARYTAETLITLRPDLVVTHAWQAAETTTVLREQGTPVLVLRSATSYADVRSTMGVCAHVLGLEKEGERVVADLDRRVASLRERAQRRAQSRPILTRALVYYNDGTGGWVAGTDTTADALLGLAGLRNAAEDAGLRRHVSVDFEKLLAIDPDVIIVGAQARDETGSATKNVLENARPLSGMRAIREHRIAVLSPALLSSDSPCLVDGAEALASALDAMLEHPGEAPTTGKKP